MAKRKKIYSSPFEVEWAVLNQKAFLPHQRVSKTQAPIQRLFLCKKVNSSAGRR